MAAEAKLWDSVQPRLREHFLVQRIENLIDAGVPDVHLVCRLTGEQHWLELKAQPEMPKRATTRVFGGDGLRPDQIPWLYSRAAVGASVWILGKAGKEWFLVYGIHARVFNDASRNALAEMSAWHHIGNLTSEAYENMRYTLREERSKNG